MPKPTVIGRWRIVEMELWDQDAVELLGPAFIEFTRDNLGSFRFIAVEGWLDVRPMVDEPAGVEFSWDGNDEGEPASGRGWARIDSDGSLAGRIFLHLGDDASFRATRSTGA